MGISLFSGKIIKWLMPFFAMIQAQDRIQRWQKHIDMHGSHLHLMTFWAVPIIQVHDISTFHGSSNALGVQ